MNLHLLLGEGQSIGWQMRYEVVVVVAVLVGLPTEMSHKQMYSNSGEMMIHSSPE